jgi:hypothetical protein
MNGPHAFPWLSVTVTSHCIGRSGVEICAASEFGHHPIKIFLMRVSLHEILRCVASGFAVVE